MNKHELKSLLENIYYTLTEAEAAPPPLLQQPWHPPLLPPGDEWHPPLLPPKPPVTPPTARRPVQPLPPAPPPIDIESQPGDDPRLIEEINAILRTLRFLRTLSVEHQDGVEELTARLRELIQRLLQQRQQRPGGGVLG